MKISKHFNSYIWEYSILPAINKACADLDNDFVKQTSLKTFRGVEKTEYRDNLSKIYKKKRKWIERSYYPVDNDKRSKLDLHKLAAVVVRSILYLKPISFDARKAVDYIDVNEKKYDIEWFIDNYFINYKIAFLAAIQILLFDMIYKASCELNNGKKCYNKEKAKKLYDYFSEKGFDFYSENSLPSNHEPFYNSVIINLVTNDLNNRDFDYWGFATICYQLQQAEFSKAMKNLNNQL